LAYFDWMVETRIATRHRVLKTATIEFGGDTIDCTVRNLSTTGAALEVPSQMGIPAKFTLVVPGDALRLPCAVVWRTEYRIGVHFD
jgi:PilZ domain